MQETLNISYQNDMPSYKDRNRITVRIWKSTITSSLNHVSIQISNPEEPERLGYYSLWASNILPTFNSIMPSNVQNAYRYDISKEDKSPDWVFCFIGRDFVIDCNAIEDQIDEDNGIVYKKISDDFIYAIIKNDGGFIAKVYDILRKVISLEWPPYDYDCHARPPTPVQSKEVLLKHLINAKFLQIRQQYPGSQKRIDEEEILWEEVINKKYNYLCHCTKLTFLLLLIGTFITVASYITNQYNPLLKNIGWGIFGLSLAILLILACYPINKTIIQPQKDLTNNLHKPLQIP